MDRLRRLAEPSPVLFRCLFASQAAILVLSPILPEVARDFGVSTATAAVLAGAQAVLGVGVGLLVAVGIAAAGEWPRPARRPHVLAWAIAGMPAAWIVGMPAVGAVVSVHRRATWIAVPTLVALVALALVRLRPADAPSRRVRGTAGAWRRPEVVSFAAGELLANAAWASVLTFTGALLLASYGLTPSATALGLGAMAAAMMPGPFRARRHAARATSALLTFLSAALTGLCAASDLIHGFRLVPRRPPLPHGAPA